VTYRFPDLEIYIRAPDVEQLAARLETVLSLSHWEQEGPLLRARIINESSQADVVLHDRAFKNYCSLWVTQNLTPWDTDLALAEWASNEFPALDVQCSQSGWSEQESPDGRVKWYRVRAGAVDEVFWD
jgi:hypothetical protein